MMNALFLLSILFVFVAFLLEIRWMKISSTILVWFGITLNVGFSMGILAGFIAFISFGLIPLLIPVITYPVKKILLLRAERDPGDTGFKPLSCYKDIIE